MNFENEFIGGIRIFVSDNITKRVYRKNHHKKRIKKKWHKKYGMIDVPDDEKIIKFNDDLYMTKKCFERIKR